MDKLIEMNWKKKTLKGVSILVYSRSLLVEDVGAKDSPVYSGLVAASRYGVALWYADENRFFD